MFTVDLTINSAGRCLILRLYDEDGGFLAGAEPVLTQALPDATTLLGPAILGHLAAGIHQRTLVVRLPDPALFPLAADLVRVPWELAVAPADARSLLEHNVVVRVALAGEAPRDLSIAPDPGKPLRVLLVFAEAPGSRPLAARLERERLLDLFFQDVLPKSDVEVDVLCHGVTNARLREQMRASGGYHVVHWNGHGHTDGLEIAPDDGRQAAVRLSCAELCGILSAAGGFVPEVMVLTACHSGSTRTALALLAAGVQQVVAMRGEVGDTYARRLARRFYRNLLADRAHHPVDAALAMARRELAEDTKRAADYQPADHAMPIVFGNATVRFEPRARRSAQMNRKAPKPQPLPSALEKPSAFIGRGAPLAALGRAWFGLPEKEKPVALVLVLGPAGIGKTHLAAEALHLWFDRFDYVLGFQAQGGSLRVEDVLKDAHGRLTAVSVAYRERCADNDQAAVYLPPAPPLTGPARDETLRNNLVDALAAERVLLVIDGLDASLLSTATAEGHEAQDPAWDRLLATLADRLPGTSSRVLVTSRLPPAALHGTRSVRIDLGFLPHTEAELFFDADAVLRTLRRGGDPNGLLPRLTAAGRGHPFVLAGFAAIAQKHAQRDGALSAGGRVALKDALKRLAADGHEALPRVFANPRGDAVAAGLVDLLIQSDAVPFEARRLLWVLARGPDPRPAASIAPACKAAGAQADLAASLDALRAAGLVREQGDGMLAVGRLVAARADAWMRAHPEDRTGWPERWTPAG
jgi:hypothetical protein